MASAYNNSVMMSTNHCWFSVEYGSFGTTDGMYYSDRGSTKTVVKYRLPCYPEDITDSVSASWNTNTIIGSTAPASAFSNTEDRAVSFSFDLHREMTGDTNEIENLLRIMRSAVYPRYDVSGMLPPITTFVFGKFKARGKLNTVSYTWKLPIINGEYYLCSVSIDMECSAIYNQSLLDTNSVRKNPSLDPFSKKW